MPFELQDDFGDDDALLNVDVDAMAAARRAAPPAGPQYGTAPPHAAPPPHARHPAQRMPYPHELPSAHQPRRGGPAAPRSTHAHAPGVTPGDHPSAPNRPVTRKPPVTGGNEGFSGHAGRNGGFGGAGGAWGESRRPPDPPRWRVGHDAVDRATASGAVRGAAAPDPNQRTVRTMFAAKEPQQHAGAKQRTLDDAFGDKRNARAASAAVVARSMRPDVSRPSFPETHSEAPPPDAHAHLRPIDLEDDWDVDRWARSEARAPARTPMGPPAAREPHPARTPAPLAPSDMGTPDSSGLVRCLDSGRGMRLDPHTAQTYVYPGQLVRREYQFDMTRAALFTNSLVCLPTGLGKTLIAAVVMKNFHRWFPRGKVVFLAPTRPLVEQQKAACRDICGMPSEETCVLMGSTKRDLDGTRRTLWRDKRLFFCTPQTMENDLRDGVCPAHDVVCLVIDEAHRAKGNHAYCGVVKQLWDRDVQFRTLALTATPGHDVAEVQSVVRALAIGRIDFRSDQDEDVRKHTHKREVRLETVVSTKANEQVLDLLRDCLRPMVKKLLGLGAFADGGVYVRGFAENTTANVVKPYTLLKAQNEMRSNPGCLNPSLAFTIFQKAHFIAKVAELLTTHTPRVAVDYVGKEDAKSYVGVLFREFPVMREALDMLRSMAGKGAHHSPKMGRLASILRKHFAKNGEFSRVMIFTSFRDSVHDIVRACREMSEASADEPDGPDSPLDAGAKSASRRGTIAGLFAGANAGNPANGANGASARDASVEAAPKKTTRHRVKVAAFIGQGDTSKGGAGGAGAARGSQVQCQQEQKSVLDAFRSGSLNTVVATSIGEEGLDIPLVDLIVFFGVVDIIRTIQRMGAAGAAPRRERGRARHRGQGGAQVQVGVRQVQLHAQEPERPRACLRLLQRLPPDAAAGPRAARRVFGARTVARGGAAARRAREGGEGDDRREDAQGPSRNGIQRGIQQERPVRVQRPRVGRAAEHRRDEPARGVRAPAGGRERHRRRPLRAVPAESHAGVPRAARAHGGGAHARHERGAGVPPAARHRREGGAGRRRRARARRRGGGPARARRRDGRGEPARGALRAAGGVGRRPLGRPRRTRTTRPRGPTTRRSGSRLR